MVQFSGPLRVDHLWFSKERYSGPCWFSKRRIELSDGYIGLLPLDRYYNFGCTISFILLSLRLVDSTVKVLCKVL